MLRTNAIYELELRDIEIVDDEPIIEVSWEDLLDVDDSRPSAQDLAGCPRRPLDWGDALENMDTRIYIRPYAARM